MIDTLILTFFLGGGEGGIGIPMSSSVPSFLFNTRPPLFECLHGTKGIELYTVRTGVNEEEEEEEREKTREGFATFQGPVLNNSAHMCEKMKIQIVFKGLLHIKKISW